MSELKLKNCPFCGGLASQPASTSPSDERCGYNFVAYVECSACGVSTRTESNHDKGGWCNESIESAKARAVKKWNSRTQPEATKPAQDLSAAILALPLPNTTLTAEVAGYKVPVYGAQHMRDFAMAALASPADALVAGDRVDAERYRFLRDHGVPETDAEIEKALTVYQGVGLNSLLPDELDSAIDAAIQAQKDGHENRNADPA